MMKKQAMNAGFPFFQNKPGIHGSSHLGVLLPLLMRKAYSPLGISGNQLATMEYAWCQPCKHCQGGLWEHSEIYPRLNSDSGFREY